MKGCYIVLNGKIGYVIDENDSDIFVNFESGKIKIAKNSAEYDTMQVLDKNISDRCNSSLLGYFSTATMYKSKVLSIMDDSFKIVDGKNIKAEVLSSNSYGSYTININFGKGVFEKCSCPVGLYCKHAYRVINYLCDLKSSDITDAVSSNMPQELIEEIELITKSFSNSYNYHDSNIDNSIRFSEIVDEYGILTLIREAQVLSQTPNCKINFSCLADLLVLHPTYPDRMITEYNYGGFGRLLKQAVYNTRSRYSNRVTKYLFYQLYVQKDYYGMLSEALNESYVDCNDLFDRFIDKIDNQNASKLIQYYLRSGFPIGRILAEYINKYYPYSFKKSFANDSVLKYLGNISMDDNTFDMIELMTFEEKRYFYFNHKEMFDDSKNYKVFLDCIYKSYSLYDEYLDDANAILSDIKDGRIHEQIILGLVIYNEIRRYKKKNEKLNYRYSIEYEGIKNNLEFSVELESIESEKLKYSINTKYGDFKYTFEKLNKDDNFCSQLNNTILQLCMDELYEEGNKLIAAARKEKIEREIKRQRDLLSDFLRDASSDSDMRLSNILAMRNKVTIEPKLYRNYFIDFTIGTDRQYKIKDLNSFIRDFRDGGIIHFGKGFTLHSDINNLDEKSKAIFDIMNYEVGATYDGEYKIIKSGLDKIIDLYQGKRLSYENELYYVSKEVIECSFSIDENLVLHMEPSLDADYIMKGYKELYYFDSVKKKIVTLKDGIKNIDLYNCFINFNGFDIKENETTFVETIYRKFENLIEVENKEALFNNINYEKIKAFVDMRDDNIVINYQFENKGETITEKEISLETKRKLEKVKCYFEQFGVEKDMISDQGSIVDFLDINFDMLNSLCEVYLSDGLVNRKNNMFPKMKYHITYENNLMNVFLEGSDYSNEELEKIYRAIKLKKKYIQLKGRDLLNIDNEESQEFYQTVTELNLSTKKLTEPNDVPFYQSFKNEMLANHGSVKQYFKNAVKDVSTFKDAEVAIPAVNAELRSYQIEGVKWLYELKKYHLGGILADDMGLGKTLETITFIKMDEVEKPSLIVCPKSLIFNWKSEFEKFDPTTNVVEIYGSSIERKDIITNIDNNKKVIYITSYDSLRNDLDNYSCNFEYLILDEAQAIKTVTSKKAMSVKQINAEYRYALTGTPIENNVLELWSIFDFIMPNFFDDIDTFKSSFEGSEEYKQLIAKRIALFILRRTKKDVLKDLPDKVEKILSAEMTEDQRKVYDSFAKEARDILQSGGKLFNVFHIFTRLRQACVDPAMFIDDYTGGSGKMDLVKETLSNYLVDGHRILIFSQFVKGLNIIEEYLHSQNIKYYILTGDTKAEDRIELCNKFNNNEEDVSVFLISLKAGGNGLNLTGADVVIHIDPWWNVAAENQATDRAYRIGQKRQVEVIKFICENSIERRVIELQNLKKDLIDSLISNSDESITKLSEEDAKFLLN